MCRLMGYLGPSISLDRLLDKPEHSLIVQSYQPREMTAGLLNADGFGVGWYHSQQETPPFTYKNILPIWNDPNLSSLSRYIESGCVLANVRSATPGLGVDVSNCQPFQQDRILFMHNGFIKNFRQTLRKAICDRLDDTSHQVIQGTTDSEHIFALLLHYWYQAPEKPLEEALHQTLTTLSELAESQQLEFSANILISNGKRLIASRFASHSPNPSLHWLRDDPTLPDAVIVASEPLFAGDWTTCPESSILTVEDDLDIQIRPI
ncbi:MULTISPECIES: ergothioneine biosynthesis protein EgtC [Trichocoleus]|uniref:Ergothioneine biosynthesis protein EgtC n=1 Tax=Trichocoleus desertorum GB2-A4 TaxID=2933944 RepID=A0ABV0JB86_9CYAN|nr:MULTISPECIES: ergothioneine biosynthesis protein EgtC [unclassified Trichocoleus]MBD1860831.1 ergothioneine biosynthesis protein EgtC [Trichocoleus sp. FACHB-46]MBD2098716.1 ergothioneine biosynthesis protein EgtC [Trichocoleus sp. FACHB-591]